MRDLNGREPLAGGLNVAGLQRSRATFICFVLFVLFMAIFAPLRSALAAPEEWKAAHTQALNWAREGKFEQALPALAGMQEKYPNAAPILFDRAVVLHWAGRDKEATTLYEAKISARRDIPTYVKEAMANAYFRQQNFAAARPIYEALAATGDRRARLMEAEVLIWQNDPAKAQKIYEALLKENPQDVEVYLSRGRARLGNGNNRRSIEDFDAARELAQKLGDAKKLQQIDALLAAACIRASDMSRAIVVLRPYIQNGQADPAMQADYVAALRSNGNLDQAIAEANRMWPNLTTAPLFGIRTLGDAYLRTQNYDQAIRVYDFVLQRDPKNHLAMLGLAVAKVQKGRVAEALQLYDKVIAMDPKLAEVVLDDCLYYVSLGKTWTAQRVFALLNARIPANADFYRQYADRLNSAGLPREAYKNYQILRGLPGGETTGAAGMSRTATSTGDYTQAKRLLDAFDQKQLRMPVVGQALREFEEREKGSLNANSVYYSDKNGKQIFSDGIAFESSLGGSVSFLGATNRIFLRDADANQTADFWSYGPGIRVRGINYDFSAFWALANRKNMDGNGVSLTVYPNDRSSFNVFTAMTSILDARAVNQGIMTRNYGGSYSWRTYNPPGQGETGLKEKDIYTVGYTQGNITDGNSSSFMALNWDRILRDDRFKRVMWSTYFSRIRYANPSDYYDSPNLRQAFGTGITHRTYVKRGYWEWKAFLEYGADAPEAWGLAPFVRLEYGHYFTSLLYLTTGCEYGLSLTNAANAGIGSGAFQCDINVNMSW